MQLEVRSWFRLWVAGVWRGADSCRGSRRRETPQVDEGTTEGRLVEQENTTDGREVAAVGWTLQNSTCEMDAQICAYALLQQC